MATAFVDFVSGIAGILFSLDDVNTYIFNLEFKGGIACVYVGQPLDTVKVKLQTFPHLYKNAITCVTQTYKKDGIYRGLYGKSF